MVLGRRKKARGQVEHVEHVDVPQGNAEPEDPADREHARLLQCWRRSEQRVLRTWHAWQAAAVGDKPERYHAYLRALADEERAAASIELATRMRAAHDDGNGVVAPARR